MKTFSIAALLALSTGAQAWGGWDYESSSSIEIDKGNLVRPGEEIEYYDYGGGGYRYGTVESVDDDEVEVYDHESGEYRVFDMD